MKKRRKEKIMIESEEMLELKDKIQDYRLQHDELQKQLISLDERYKGHTPEQQKTLEILKNMDQSYINRRKVIIAELDLFRAKIEEYIEEYQKLYDRNEKAWYDVMMDIDF